MTSKPIAKRLLTLPLSGQNLLARVFVRLPVGTFIQVRLNRELQRPNGGPSGKAR